MIREDNGKELVFSVRQGEKYTHDNVRNIGGAGLDLKKRLNKGKLPDVKPEPTTPPTKPKTTKTKTPSGLGLDEPIMTKPSSTGNAMGEINREREKPKTPKTKGSEQREKESEEQPTLNPRYDQLLRSSPAWHGAIDRTTAEGLLKDKPDQWLLRVGRDGFVALSFNKKGKLAHLLVNSDEEYGKVERYMRSVPNGGLKP